MALETSSWSELKIIKESEENNKKTLWDNVNHPNLMSLRFKYKIQKQGLWGPLHLWIDSFLSWKSADLLWIGPFSGKGNFKNKTKDCIYTHFKKNSHRKMKVRICLLKIHRKNFLLYLNGYFNFHVCLFIRLCVRLSLHVSENYLEFQQSYSTSHQKDGFLIFFCQMRSPVTFAYW